MQTTRFLSVALATLGTMTAIDAQWRTGDALPALRLPEVRSVLEPRAAAAIDLAQYRSRRLVLIEFASW
ncbi:MAG: hypothetical protein WD226_11975 [Planctomycetota bacterium]